MRTDKRKIDTDMGSELMQCGACGSDSVKKKYAKNGYDFLECDQCGLLFTDNTKKVPGYMVYNPEYTRRRTLWAEDKKDGLVKDFRARSARRLLDQIGKHVAKSPKAPLRLLDIGCGEGYLLDEARRYGYEIYGTEISGSSAKLASEKIGKPVFTGTMTEAGFPDGHFDVVCLIDVIEHFSAPIDQISQIKRVLKKGGILCVQTPNLKSFYSIIMGQRWFQLKPGEHLFYFSDHNLPILLKRLDFKIAANKATGIYVSGRYLAAILSQTNPALAKAVAAVLKIFFMYDTVLYLPSGHLLCIAKNG